MARESRVIDMEPTAGRLRRGIELAPVLDQRDVGMGDGGRFHRLPPPPHDTRESTTAHSTVKWEAMSAPLSTSLRTGLALAVGFTALAASGQEIYPQSPDWISADTQVSTGAALVDLDRDGWLDLVVANGNDMAQQRLAVYYNHGDGTFPPTPTWQSADTAYNGHLDVADVNGDGWPDVAVAVLGAFSSVDHAAKLYLNTDGTLSSTPTGSRTSSPTPSAVPSATSTTTAGPTSPLATGWAYTPQNFYSQYVYLNNGGTLSSTASWSSDRRRSPAGRAVGRRRPRRLARPGGGRLAAPRRGSTPTSAASLETTASWSTTDSANQDAIMGVCGDVNGDGFGDLIVTDNTQLTGGSGRFRQYDGLAAGFFATTARLELLRRLRLGGGPGRRRRRRRPRPGHRRLVGPHPAVPQRRHGPAGQSRTGARHGRPAWSRRSSSATSTATPCAPRSSVFPAAGGRLFQLSRRPIQEVVAVRRDRGRARAARVLARIGTTAGSPSRWPRPWTSSSSTGGRPRPTWRSPTGTARSATSCTTADSVGSSRTTSSPVTFRCGAPRFHSEVSTLPPVAPNFQSATCDL